MNGTMSSVALRCLMLPCLLFTLGAGHAAAVSPDELPIINSLSVTGTNLVFNANFPSGVSRALLEFRPALTDAWQQAAMLDVPTNGGTVEFSIPQPALDMAFFRLNVTLGTASQPALSEEVHYTTTPPLTEISTNGSTEAVFHFNGEIDGSDRIVITRKGALWEHVHWSWPGTVAVNDSIWNPSEKNFLTTTGAVAFLPEQYSLGAADLEVIKGRDIAAMERTNDALIVYLDDTPSGAAPYEFKVHFHPAAAASPPALSSTVARLKIAAQIDGSDRLKITTHEATWMHMAYAPPQGVRINGLPWDVSQTNVLFNTGTNTFLPPGIDFLTAKIVARRARDLASMWADKDAVYVSFADNPNGGDAYELEISFGQ